MEATLRKKLSEAARLTAVTGMVISVGHKHRGIQPVNKPDEQPYLIRPAQNADQAITQGMDAVTDMWPGCNSWNLVGCDATTPGGDWVDPQVYATWDSYDVYDGGGTGAADGFSSGGSDPV